MELLVVLVILSILAAAALPYAEVTVKRNKEIELRRTLREIRTAIDQFHADWKEGKIGKYSDASSESGYPKSLDILVEGVELSGVNAAHRFYLRRILPDPFADQSNPTYEQWILRSYQDEPDSYTWGGQDVYDVRSGSERTALNGTYYKDW